ncbi:MAG: (deoxy)nucleoside triphosphate pyrophosphohydrolase [Pirellulales bacterium]|nr:(deoxy)nucleoside triphosphate pyrophosphohydrolase [Pirellulales bacterium]
MPGQVTIAVAVVEHEGRYLIGLREPGVPLAGYWEFPGGKVRDDETPAQAAARECLEETGLAVSVGKLHALVDHAYEHGHLRLHFFACQTQGVPAPVPERFRWVAASELASYRFPPANVGLVEQLIRGAASSE